MIKACLMILAGGFAAQHSRVTLCSDHCLLVLVASIILMPVGRARPVAFLLLGLSLFMLAGHSIVDARLDARYEGDSMLARVRIADFPEFSASSVTMIVAPLDDSRLPPRSRVSWYEPAVRPAVGDIWDLELRLKRPRGTSNPGGFDYEAWMFRSALHASGYVVDSKRNRLVSTGALSAAEAFRSRFVGQAETVSRSAATAAVLAAVGVGARHGISDEQWRRYAQSGTSHLVAISGLHVGLAAAFAAFVVLLVLGVLRAGENNFVISLWAGAVAALGYAVISGLGVPSQRAVLMLLIGAVAITRRRQVSAGKIVAAAAILVYIKNPVTTMQPGFNLSFAAVVLLLWLARCRDKSPLPVHCHLRRFADSMRGLLRIQLLLFFGLLPLTLMYFQRIAPLSVVTNLVAVPLFSFVVVPATLIGMVLGAGSAVLAEWPLRFAALGIDQLEALIATAVRLPMAEITVTGITGVHWLLAAAPALWALLPRAWPGRHIAILAIAVLLLRPPAAPPDGCVDLHVLDVGQGLSAVLQTAKSTVIYDTGVSFRDGGSMAERVVLPFLRALGVRDVEWLLVSHSDIDHSGGIDAILSQARVQNVLLGEALPIVAGRACRAGQGWRADGVQFEVLHPVEDGTASGNNASCVLQVRIGRHGLLFTGDIEVSAEQALLRRGALLATDVVIVPHHGSLTSSSPQLVSALAPSLAIVPAGHGNRWGFPKESVVMRWQAGGAELLVTGASGAVSVRLCGQDGIRMVREDRKARRRFWRAVE